MKKMTNQEMMNVNGGRDDFNNTISSFMDRALCELLGGTWISVYVPPSTSGGGGVYSWCIF